MWRARALQTEAWDRAAFIAWKVFGGKISDYQPLREQESLTSLSDLQKSIAEARKFLPAKLTEAEKEARWQKFLRGTDTNFTQ